MRQFAFRRLIKVAEKIDREPCWVALCTPELENEEWWEILCEIPHTRVVLPRKGKLFSVDSEKQPCPRRLGER